MELSASELARLLAEQGDIDGLRAQADQGDWNAQYQLAELLVVRGDMDGLRARADNATGIHKAGSQYCSQSEVTWNDCGREPTKATPVPDTPPSAAG
jgi:hypothetical protein